MTALPINTADSGSSEICPELSSTAMAMGTSYAGPAFLRSAGARFTVMRRMGNSKPELRMAARTLSRASWTAVSGQPHDSERG